MRFQYSRSDIDEKGYEIGLGGSHMGWGVRCGEGRVESMDFHVVLMHMHSDVESLMNWLSKCQPRRAKIPLLFKKSFIVGHMFLSRRQLHDLLPSPGQWCKHVHVIVMFLAQDRGKSPPHPCRKKIPTIRRTVQ